jgi:Tol biopolymer transport system component
LAGLLEHTSRALSDRYRIERELGHGGMAVVFLARDLRHERPVAIKVLRPELAAALGPQRFLREIQLAARLTHPHILPLLDSGEADGLLYYTMPFVEGETLRQRLERERQLPVEDSLRIARKVADALDHAHRQGVVHRDIKPENILFAAGHAVVADFGIAHAMEVAGGEKLTTTGVILGTPAYLSPEQAAGSRLVDARTDQYSLACVVYEMLAGQPPFTGPTAESLMHQHLSVAPRTVTELRPAVPAALADTLTRALAKNPADRFPDTARFADSLVLPAAPVPQRTAPAAAASARRRGVIWAGVALLAVTATAVGLWLWRQRPPQAEELALTRVTYDSGLTIDPAISRDGKLVAYASDRGGDGNLDLWVQYLDGRTASRLTHHPAVDWQPSFSPDGSRIAFRSERDGGGIYVVSTLGGEERRIADHGAYPRFSPDGSLIAYMESLPFTDGLCRMFVVPPDGGPPRAFQPEFRTYPMPGSVGPIWSPDGKSLLFCGQRVGQPESEDWWVAPVAGGPAVSTGALRAIGSVGPVQFPCLWLPRKVIFAAGMTFQGINLYQASIDPGGRRIRGAAIRLTSGPGMKYSATVFADGRIVMSDMTWTVHLWALDLDPARQLAIGGPTRLTTETAPKFGLSTSRDGSKLAYTTYSGTMEKLRTEERVRNLATGNETTPWVGTSDLVSLDARLNADGSVLSYVDLVGGRLASFVLRGQETVGRQVCEGCRLQGFFSGDREALARFGRSRLARLDLSTGAQTPLVDTGAGVIASTDLSPDDRWIAMAVGTPSDGRIRIYAVPVREGPTPEKDWIPIVDEPCWSGTLRWSPDGSRVYFISSRDEFICLWAQRLDPATKHPAGEPYAVLHAHQATHMLYGPSSAWSFGVTPRQLIFNASEVAGNIWQAKLGAR